MSSVWLVVFGDTVGETENANILGGILLQHDLPRQCETLPIRHRWPPLTRDPKRMIGNHKRSEKGETTQTMMKFSQVQVVMAVVLEVVTSPSRRRRPTKTVNAGTSAIASQTGNVREGVDIDLNHLHREDASQKNEARKVRIVEAA